jgi:hypothetical protein
VDASAAVEDQKPGGHGAMRAIRVVVVPDQELRVHRPKRALLVTSSGAWEVVVAQRGSKLEDDRDPSSWMRPGLDDPGAF